MIFIEIQVDFYTFVIKNLIQRKQKLGEKK